MKIYSFNIGLLASSLCISTLSIATNTITTLQSNCGWYLLAGATMNKPAVMFKSIVDKINNPKIELKITKPDFNLSIGYLSRVVGSIYLAAQANYEISSKVILADTKIEDSYDGKNIYIKNDTLDLGLRLGFDVWSASLVYAGLGINFDDPIKTFYIKDLRTKEHYINQFKNMNKDLYYNIGFSKTISNNLALVLNYKEMLGKIDDIKIKIDTNGLVVWHIKPSARSLSLGIALNF